MVDKVDKIWLDGKLIPWDQANVHVLTHTLHYGLGVFEGIRCYKLKDGRADDDCQTKIPASIHDPRLYV